MRRAIRSGFSPVLVVGVAISLYLNSLSVPFLFDDYPQIVNNEGIQRLDSPRAYLLHPRGLLVSTLALNYQWGGLDVWGYHVFNVAVHGLNGLLVNALVLWTLRMPFFAEQYVRHAHVLALLVSLVFVAHPLQTMAATYIIQRAESLAALFSLVTLVCFIRGVTAHGNWHRGLAYVLAVVSSYCGVLTKETAATVPLVVVLFDRCFLSNGRLRDIRWRWLLHACLLATVALPLWRSWQHLPPTLGGARAALVAPMRGNESVAPGPDRIEDRAADGAASQPQRDAGLHDQDEPPTWLEIPTAGLDVPGVTPWRYLLTQFGVVVWYLRLYVLPTRLCFDYGWPMVESAWHTDVVLPFLLLLCLALAAVASFQRYRLATFCCGWVFLALAPTSSVIPLADAAFEHRMYVPVVGLAWLTIVASYDVLRRLGRRWRVDERRLYPAALALVVAWLGALGTLTVTRNQVLRDPLALAAVSAVKSPHNWRPHYDLGNELMRRQRWDEAIDALQSAVRCDPGKGPPRIHLAQLYLRQGMFSAAEAELKAATRAGERSVVAAAHRQLGYVYLQRGALDDAQTALLTAARLMPSWSFVHKHLARLYARKGEWAQAAEALETALRQNANLAAELRSEAAAAHYRAGRAWFTQGEMRRAAASFENAVRHRADSAAAHHYLAITYAQLGAWAGASAAIETAARLRRNDPLVAENLERIRAHRRPLAPVEQRPGTVP